MNLIALETSTENCSVALLNNGEISSKNKVAPQKHAELVLGYLDELLAARDLQKNQIEGIVFGQGPGAFTGVRIAMSVVQGLALALEIPVVAISTMHNMAFQIWSQQSSNHSKILVANDARMGEVYWAAFEVQNNALIRISDDALNAPGEIQTEGFDVCAGSAFQSMIQANNQSAIYPELLPDAITLLELAKNSFASQAKNIIEVQPTYIREKVVFN